MQEGPLWQRGARSSGLPTGALPQQQNTLSAFRPDYAPVVAEQDKRGSHGGSRRREQESMRLLRKQWVEAMGMKRKLSPMFAVIVILFALAVGALWFMVSYRAHEAREAAYSAMLKQQADRARESGMSGMQGPRGARGGGGGASSRAPGRGGERGRAPGTRSAGQ